MTKKQLLADWADLFPNFTPKEINCNCTACGGELWNERDFGDEVPEYFIDDMHALQDLRNAWGKPMQINSAHRCVEHNANVGGAKASQHLDLAFDVVIDENEQKAFSDLAREFDFLGIGLYKSRGFVHLDRRAELTVWHG